MYPIRPRNHLGFSTKFMQQCSGLQRALSTPDHEHLLASKFSEIMVF
jgi:hypothetical protein